MISYFEIVLDVELSDDSTVRVFAKGSSDPGRCYGAPEDCYPPESEMEIRRVATVGENGRLTDVASDDWEEWFGAHGVDIWDCLADAPPDVEDPEDARADYLADLAYDREVDW